MRVTIEIPKHVAADLKRIIRRTYGDLSLAGTIATCIVYCLASSSRAKDRNAEEYFADLALRLIAMQSRSND
jgi:hypothetical protein